MIFEKLFEGAKHASVPFVDVGGHAQVEFPCHLYRSFLIASEALEQELAYPARTVFQVRLALPRFV